MEAFALGAVVGLLLALTGAGGGILAVPLLVFALHLGLAKAAPIGLLAVGPMVITALLGNKGFHYGRVGLAVVAIGMGFHLTAGTLNQAALARNRAGMAAAAWLTAAALFVVFVATPTISSEVTRVEVGYCLSALVLSGLLTLVYRRGAATSAMSAATARAG